jgi:Tol biopolymer transport system component
MKALKFFVIVGFLIFCAALVVASSRSQEQKFQQAIHLMETKGDYPAAIRLFEEVAKGPDRTLAARSLLYVGLCYEKLGNTEAKKAYERVIKEFADQREVALEARKRLAVLTKAESGREKPAISMRQIWAGSKEVAYEWFSKKTFERLRNSSEYDLRIIGLDGSNPRVLYENPEVGYYWPLVWSPDKRFVATVFYRNDRTTQLALVFLHDGSARILKSFDWRSPTTLSVSPDSRWIVYDFPTKEDETQRGIYLLATDGSREIALVQHPAHDYAPIWTADGKRVLFVSDRGGAPGFWVLGVDEGKPQGDPRLIKPNVGQITPLGMTDNGSFYRGISLERNNIYVAGLDAATARLTSSPEIVSQRFVGHNSVPAWSPNGESIAYIARTMGFENSTIVIRSVKTDEERELPPEMSFGFELAWSPDGRTLLASARDAKGRWAMYQIDAQTGKTSLIVQAGSTCSEGCAPKGWFPDGKSIFYVRRVPADKPFEGRLGIARRNLKTEAEEELFAYENFALRFATLSPDGRQFAAWLIDNENRRKTIILIPTDKSQARELLQVDDASSEQNTAGTPPGLAWTPDGNYVIFGKRMGRDNSTELWRVDVESGKPEKLTTVAYKVHDMVIHPNGNRIAYSTRESKNEVWVMENFLPALTDTQ